MKKHITNSSFRISILLLFGLISSEFVNAQYCQPQDMGSYSTFYISNVEIGNISNSTNGSTGDYTYYSSISATDITVGETLTGTVSVTLNGWNRNNNNVIIWFNFNASDDSDFNNNGEEFKFTVRDNNWVPGLKTLNVPISIPIPANAQLGASRMRVGFRDRTNNNFSSCDYNWRSGEVEDYNINFVSNAPSPAEIDVSGNGISINDGANTTDNLNNTFFGTHETFSPVPLQRQFTIQNLGNLNLNLTGNPIVSFVNPTSDFSIEQPTSSVLGENETVNFTVNFNPTSIGLKQAVISIASNDDDEDPFTFLVEGEGMQSFPDTDGDGIPDSVDLDDDNDGLLDTQEISCSSNILINGGFEDATGLSLGNNLNTAANLPQIQPWSNVIPGPDTPLNLIRVDGPGPHNYAGNPQNDARGGAGVYFDVTGSSGSIYQPFTITTATTIEYSAYFSSRDNRTNTGGGIIRIREGNDLSGPIVSSIDNVVSANSSSWTFVSNTTALLPGNYVIELFVDDDQNVDEVSVKDMSSCDSDGDGIPNIKDLDDDNDGIPNVVELGLTDNDRDGTLFNDTVQTWTDTNNDGVHDAFTNIVLKDSDNDGVPDYLDLDSDNDGIFDVLEYDGFGDSDINGDGTGDGDDIYSNNTSDEKDGDGILGIIDGNDTSNTNTFGTSNYPDPIDSDGDNIPDYLDTDSNDASNNPSNGTDISGTFYATLDSNNDGRIDGASDADNDGILDNFDTDNSNFGSPRDIDGSLSLYFDGRNDYVEDASNVLQGLTKVTQMAWVKLDPNFNQQAAIIGQSNFWISVLPNRKLRVYMNQGNTVETDRRLNLNEWVHIAAVYDGAAQGDTLKIFINGNEESSTRLTSGAIIPTPAVAYRIGRKPWDAGDPYYFYGEIDEVRVFNNNLTTEELRRVIYQELDETKSFNTGHVVPKAISSNNVGGNLIRYYKMDTYKDDILDNKVTVQVDAVTGAKIYNVKEIYRQTAPLPYRTKQDGNWENEATWLHGDVWDIDNMEAISEWSIVNLSNNVTTDKELANAGLIIETDKTLTINDTNPVYNSWYLELNGTLDLHDDSQLIQSDESDLVTSANGKILRRQEGTPNKYWYNYWASPVGNPEQTAITNNNGNANNTNNGPFSLNQLKDGDGNNFEFTNQYDAVGKISTRWLYTFRNGVTYYDYGAVSPTTLLEPGIGYTQKGTGVSVSEQQYLFEGKPNNGTILIDVLDAGGNGSVPGVSRTDYLVGNPYPSALDLHKFIDDNEGVISGSIQLWQQWSGASHALNEYNGGYAQVTKLGSTRAYQFIGIVGGQNGSQDGTKIASRYIPVGQGFMVEIVGDGTLKFQNSQRLFIKESDANGSYNNGSVFFRGANVITGKRNEVNEDQVSEDDNLMQKLRIEFNSVNGPQTRRELLLGFSDFTTDQYDYGYDAKNLDVYDDDLNLVLNDDKMLIQAYGPLTQDRSIPLNLRASGTFNYTIQITEAENFDEDQEVYVKDNLTGDYFDLRNSQIYEFSSEAGEFADRLEIVFQNESQSLSQTEETLEELNLYYSPGRNRIVVLNPNNIEITRVEVFNISGQSVYQTTDIYQSTYNEYQLNNLSSGGYVVQLVTAANTTMTKKIIVN